MVYLKLVLGVALLARSAVAGGMVCVERAVTGLDAPGSNASRGTWGIHRWLHVAANGWLVVYLRIDVGFCQSKPLCFSAAIFRFA